jgi:GxxExxY protein
MITKKYLDDLTYRVIGCAIEVHKQIGPGLIESVYEKCLAREFELRNIQYQKQLWVPYNIRVYKSIQN